MIPHDGTRRGVASGWLRREQQPADDALTAELAAAMRVIPGEETAKRAGRDAWKIHQQQRERSAQ